MGCLLGFVLAAYRSGAAPAPALTGAVAALLAYTLPLPLLHLSRKPLTWGVLGYCVAALLVGGLVGHLYCVAALLVGGLVGHLAGRRHTAAG